MMIEKTNEGAEALALRALGWAVSDGDRASRLLSLTGLTPDQLRARLGDRSLLAASLVFLEAYEPDLISCAEALGVPPARLVSARQVLER